MARYFLHLRDGSDETLDPDGLEFDEIELLKRAVLVSARDLIAADAHRGLIDFGYRIDAEDESGKVVHTLEFADAVDLVRMPA